MVFLLLDFILTVVYSINTINCFEVYRYIKGAGRGDPVGLLGWRRWPGMSYRVGALSCRLWPRRAGLMKCAREPGRKGRPMRAGQDGRAGALGRGPLLEQIARRPEAIGSVRLLGAADRTLAEFNPCRRWDLLSARSSRSRAIPQSWCAKTNGSLGLLTSPLWIPPYPQRDKSFGVKTL